MFPNPHRRLPTSTYLIARLVLAVLAGLVTTAYVARIRSGDVTSYSLTGEPVFLVAFAAIGTAGFVLRLMVSR